MDLDVMAIVNNWIEKNLETWSQQGFQICNHNWTSGRSKNSIQLEINHNEILSTIQIWESGECDFLQIYESQEIGSDNKYFKNVIIKSEDQLNKELDNYFINFKNLSGSSVDPIHFPVNDSEKSLHSPPI